ncbi:MULTISPECIES: hypothetical protein [Roseomonadaceae]|uniref:Uncharacterized protein n=1 Tax=Falsiroseomonas oleicola TaxID=2801474 RepID=A0ABS6HEV6_9PROT|nr:hypothetical protein [Roseomonas oleicola]MBU8547279.1 hypothetical protein [Roseomonas oleicola]
MPTTLETGSGSNHKIVVRPGARSIFLAFGTDAPNATDTTTPVSVARFTDPEGAFGKGVPGFVDSLDSLFCWLRGLGTELPIHLVGEGAGATVALLANMLLPKARMLAVNPLTVPESFTEAGALPHPFWGQVDHLASGLPAKQMGVTALCSWDPAAAAMLRREETLRPAYGTIVELPCRSNGIAYLRRKRALGVLLERGSDALRALMDEEVVSLPYAHGKPRQYAAFHEVHAAMGRGQSGRKRAMRLVEADADWTNPGWQHLRATLLRRENAPAEALEAARLAARSAPEVAEFCVGYARMVQEKQSVEDVAIATALLEPFLRQRGIAELRDSLSAVG